MNDRERFIACMEYQPADRRPNHELGVWGQTRTRWERENPDAVRDFTWNWFDGETALGMDRREFVKTAGTAAAGFLFVTPGIAFGSTANSPTDWTASRNSSSRGPC